MLDNLMIWGLWLTSALSLLIIACGALMRRNLRGVRIDPKRRLAAILSGIGLLLGSSSILLNLIGRSTQPTVDHYLFAWIEGILVFLGILLTAAAVGVLAQYQNELRSRAQNEQTL